MCGYNKMAFLLECLEDLDKQFREVGSQLYFVK
jgi:deoxyribodipyrimidine photolyase